MAKGLFTSIADGGRPRLNSENAFGWPTHCGFLHLRPIPLHSRDERLGRSPLLFLISIFLFSKFREFQAGGRALIPKNTFGLTLGETGVKSSPMFRHFRT